MRQRARGEIKKKNLAPSIITPSYASGQVLECGTLARIPTRCMPRSKWDEKAETTLRMEPTMVSVGES